MVRARSFANVAAYRAASNPAWCRIFREISCFSPLNFGTLFRCCVLGQGTLPSHVSLTQLLQFLTILALASPLKSLTHPHVVENVI